MPDERKKKQRTPQERSLDPAAQEMLIRADELGLGTAFSRAEQMAPCPIGADGSCCRLCFMGPCRLVKDGQTGVCGATIETITARNFARADRRRLGRPLGPRPRPGAHPAGRRQGRSPGLHHPRSVQASAPWPPSSRSRPKAGRSATSPSTWPNLSWRSSASRRARSFTIERAPKARKALWREQKLRAARHRPRDRRRAAPHAHGRRSGRRSTSLHQALRARPGRRLGRLDDRHRPFGHPVRHPQPAGFPGQPGCAARTTRSTSSCTGTSRRSRR